jgi:hypothetical protein
MTNKIISESNKEKVRQRIIEFCNNSYESVIFLKGDWGIGKTYLVDEIQEQSNEKDDFLIVSLFGLNSIDEVKSRIISPYNRENTLKGIFNEVMKNFEDNKASMVANFSIGLFDYISESRLKNKIIIFDDFERKGDNLSSLSILGLIDFLKTKKNKIIILSNESKLIKNEVINSRNINNDSWQILKEKVIDCEIQLKINHEDCLKVVMKEIHEDDLEYIVMKQLLIETNLVNIRIAKLIKNRLKEMFDIFKSKLNSGNKQVLTDILNNSAKMFYIYYFKENYNDYLKNFPDFFYGNQVEEFLHNSINSDEKDEISLFLDTLSIKYSVGVKDFYNSVYDAIKWGFWNIDELEKNLQHILDKKELLENEAELYEFYTKSHYGIVNDFEEKIDKFLSKKLYNPGVICMIYEILKRLNHPKKMLYKEKIDNLNLPQAFAPNFYKDNPEFISPLQQQYMEKKKNVLLSLNSMIVYEHAQDYVIQYLNNISEIELKELFKAELANNNLMMIFEQLNIIKNHHQYANFIKTLKSLFENIINSDEDENLKRIILLNRID